MSGDDTCVRSDTWNLTLWAFHVIWGLGPLMDRIGVL